MDIILKKNPLFSIIIPTYNQANFLPHALDSIKFQSYKNWEALIINDGSTDNTALIAESYCRKDERFKVFHKNNGGTASALNEGIKRAVGTWICWLSSDDLFERDKLYMHFTETKKNNKINFYYTHFFYLYDKFGTKSAPELWNEIPNRKFQVLNFFSGPYIHGNSVAIHRNIFETIGIFDETYPHGHDFEMWLRISSKFESKFINKRTCTTRWHASQTTHEFPEAGFFDSARASIEFINNHEFPEIFPLIDLKDPKHATSAIIESVNITLNNNAVIHKFGTSTAIIERLAEWIHKEDNIDNKKTLIKIAKFIIQKHTKQNQLQLTIAKYLIELMERKSFSYKNYDPLYEAKKYSQFLIESKQYNKSESILRYINFINKKLNLIEKSDNNLFEKNCNKNYIKKNDEILLASNYHELKKITPQIRILIYYSGLHNSTTPYAGTSNALIKLAKYLKRNHNLNITLTGNYVKEIEYLDGLQLNILPEPQSIQDFSDYFDVIIFATHLDLFENITKRANQIWILHQHCWNIGPNELSKLHTFDSIIALSSIHKSNIQSQGVDANIIHIAPNLLDTELFYPRKVQRDNYSIMFAGAIVEHKNVHILIEAFKILYSFNKNISLHIYGSASMWIESNNYENNLHKYKNNSIYFYGRAKNDDMPYHYSRHSIYCMPSMLESFGLGTIEAQSCGCIPVVYNSGGVSATLRNNTTGYLYKENSPIILAKELNNALHNVLQNKSIRTEAMRYVKNKFNESLVTNQYLNILRTSYSNITR